MWKQAKQIELGTGDRERMEKLIATGSTSQKVVLRARIVLGASEGVSNSALAKQLYTSRPTVIEWRKRYEQSGVEGILQDAPRSGRKKVIGPDKIEAVINATLQTTPSDATHWSTRTMAKKQKISRSTVQRIWKAYGLQPHRVETFKLSTDPNFVSKLRDVVGLYLNPPDKALVLCVDEKSQIQALDRTQPVFPLRPGVPERQTHDYVRHGTTTLFAALNMLDGKVIGECLPRHRHTEFLKFMKTIERSTEKDKEIHLILDNYATHKHKNVREWFKKHPRYHLHFTPTSASWLNMVERFFAEITRKRIRRGTFLSVAELKKAIVSYIRVHNKKPRPFIWTASPSQIMEKIQYCKDNSES